MPCCKCCCEGGSPGGVCCGENCCVRPGVCCDGTCCPEGEFCCGEGCCPDGNNCCDGVCQSEPCEPPCDPPCDNCSDCIDGECVSRCAEGENCCDGNCLECCDDPDCPEGQVCVNGECVEGPGVNCTCDCPGPEMVFPNQVEQELVPDWLASPRCFPPPTGAHGRSGSWGTFNVNNVMLDPCGSPFPPEPPAGTYDCDGTEGPWRVDDGNGCDSAWVIPEGVAKYANCPLRVWTAYSNRVVTPTQSSEELGCECYWDRQGVLTSWHVYALNCETNSWDDVTSEVLQRNVFRGCTSRWLIFADADCGVEKPPVPYFSSIIPPGSISVECNPLP